MFVVRCVLLVDFCVLFDCVCRCSLSVASCS